VLADLVRERRVSATGEYFELAQSGGDYTDSWFYASVCLSASALLVSVLVLTRKRAVTARPEHGSAVH
jgi:hypothetical protein